MKKVRGILSALFILLFSSFAVADVINIPADQPTIQSGINVANDGDTVLVQPGIYVENVNFNGKNITVTSLFLTTQDTSYISQTVIDGNQNGSSVVTFENGEDSTAILCGFTITNGMAPMGSGIYCFGSDPIIEYVIIINNSSAEGGGGIYGHYTNLNINNFKLINNSSGIGGMGGGGGGIALVQSNNSTLVNGVIAENTTFSSGGGISCLYSNPNLENVTITGNSASNYGGGICCYSNSSPSLVNCILWNDSPQEISGSVTAIYSDIQGGWTGEGNIDADPLFVDPENGDFHLTWANYPIPDSTKSPCIDTGNPDTTGLNLPEFDLDGNPRIWDGDNNGIPIIDMGCYEFFTGSSQVFYLTENWNWISFNIEHTDSSLDYVFGSLGSDIYQVKSQTQSATIYNGTWIGDLTHINIGEGYLIKMNNASQFVSYGIPIDYINTPIILTEDWNWIAYLPQQIASLEIALASIVDNAYQIKNQTQSAINYNGIWFGDLTIMEPGVGYKLNMTAPDTLIYQVSR